MSKALENSKSWEELAIGLYDKLTGRNAIIEYNFDSFKLGVPKEAGSEELTEWTMNGKISVTTYERK
jgi:hypothetical protein